MFEELVHHIKDSRPTVLVVGEPVFEVAEKAAAECGISDYNIYVMEEKDHGKFKSIWSLVGEEELEPRRLSPQEVRERTAFMCYSSGTTGMAKGGAVQYNNMLMRTMLNISYYSGDHSLQSDIRCLAENGPGPYYLE